MANTTNFNWETPDDTDLVKDGAAAIRTLGSAIDTSLVDLKGGTTGQVLSKATNTDMDFTWVAQDDSNAIQNAIIDAKGDLIVGASNDTPARLAVGTNDYVLTADSTATNGVKWAALPASGSSFVGCKITKTADQTLSNNTPTMLTWDDEDFDTNTFHSNSTNNTRITIPSGKGGYYLVTGYLGMYPAGSPSGNFYLSFYINGTQKRVNVNHMGSDNAAQVVEIYNLSAGDYLEAEAYQNSGGSATVRGGAANESSFAVQYLGA